MTSKIRLRRRYLLKADDADEGSIWGRDNWKAEEAAPMATPRKMDSSPTGYWTITDTGNNASVNAFGALLIGGVVDGADDPRFVFADENGNPIALERKPGLAMIWEWVIGATDHVPLIGFANVNPPATTTDYENGLRIRAPTKFLSPSDSITPVLYDLQSGDGIVCAVVLRNEGALYMADVNSEGWKIYWVEDTGSTAELYPTMSVIATGSYPNRVITIAQLPRPYFSNDPMAIFKFEGDIPSGTVKTTGSGDFIMRWTLDASTDAEMAIRYVDANNYWEVRRSGSSLILTKVVDGTPTDVASASSAVTGGEIITCIADDTRIQVFAGDTSEIDYTTATEFVDADKADALTTGELDWFCWYRIVSEQSNKAVNLLDAYKE